MKDVLRFRGLNEETRTAGPGVRLEYFTKGCHRGITSPCPGCFNEDTWSFDGPFKEFTVDELVENILFKSTTNNITFCGGEPILQARLLLQVVKKLKKINPKFHFVLYTSYNYKRLMQLGKLDITTNSKDHSPNTIQTLKEYSYNTRVVNFSSGEDEKFVYSHQILDKKTILDIIDTFDLVVDGEYRHELRLTNHKTMHSGGFIGSSNQKVIYGRNKDKLLYYKSEDYPYVDGVLNKDEIFCKNCLSPTKNYKEELCNECIEGDVC